MGEGLGMREREICLNPSKSRLNFLGIDLDKIKTDK